MMSLFKFILSLIILTSAVDTAFANNTPVAKVNGKTLTSFELNEEFQAILPMMGSYHGGVSKEKVAEVREKALNALIEKELQYQYAVEKGLSVPKKEIDSEFSKTEAGFGSSKKLKEAMSKSSITKDELKEFIKKRLLITKARELEVTSRATISNEELRDYYEKNKGTFKRPEEFRASHILIGVDPSASKEERDKKLKLAKEVLAKIKSGEDFTKLAMRYSSDQGSAPIGGDLGTFHKGMAEEAFEKAILSLKIGEVSDVVETIYGYHIIVLTDYKPEALLTFDEVKTDLKGKLEKKRGEELYKKWIDGLRARANIEIINK